VIDIGAPGGDNLPVCTGSRSDDEPWMIIKNKIADEQGERRRLIEDAVLRSSLRAKIPYRAPYLSAPVIEMPVGTLIFCANNGRLTVRKGQYVTHHSLLGRIVAGRLVVRVISRLAMVAMQRSR
jgi:hypothetical protein